MKTQSIQSSNKVHVQLANLIKQRFGVFLEVEHNRFEGTPYERNRNLPRAMTIVTAYKTIQDARSGQNWIASATAKCSWNDQFVRAQGLTVALRRLYRTLAEQEKIA